MKRLLLPFTARLEMDVLHTLVLLASNQHATLVPLSLITLPSSPDEYVRPEFLHQSNDFFEAVRYKAVRYHLPLETYEIFTHEVMISLSESVRQLHCDGMLLASRGKRGCFLPLEVIEGLLATKPCPLFLTQFPPRAPEFWRTKLHTLLYSWRAKEQSLSEYPAATPSSHSVREEEKEREAAV